MQSALQQSDLTKKPANVAPVRIVTTPAHARRHEYLYLLDDPKDTSGAVSEITALTTRRSWSTSATAPRARRLQNCSRSTYAARRRRSPKAVGYDTNGGRLIGARASRPRRTDDTATAAAGSGQSRHHAGHKSLDGRPGRLLTGLDPTGGFFGHDKVEASLRRHGRTLILSNDTTSHRRLTNAAPPSRCNAKDAANGQQDDGEYLAVDTASCRPLTTPLR